MFAQANVCLLYTSAVQVVHRALADSARRWVGVSAEPTVRFVADVSVIHRWNEAKG